MFQPAFSYPGKTGAEVAAMYLGAEAKGFHKIAAFIRIKYAENAPSADHFNDFIRTIHDRTCGANTLF